jgi:hypothetical protein
MRAIDPISETKHRSGLRSPVSACAIAAIVRPQPTPILTAPSRPIRAGNPAASIPTARRAAASSGLAMRATRSPVSPQRAASRPASASVPVVSCSMDTRASP